MWTAVLVCGYAENIYSLYIISLGSVFFIASITRSSHSSFTSDPVLSVTVFTAAHLSLLHSSTSSTAKEQTLFRSVQFAVWLLVK